MPIHGIAHYNFRLARALLEEVKVFYEQVVGLQVGVRPAFQSFGYWLYANGSDVLHLSEELPEDRRRKGSDLTFDHVALAATDWPSFKERLLHFQVPFTEEFVPTTNRRQVFFRDPAGNGVELLFPPNAA